MIAAATGVNHQLHFEEKCPGRFATEYSSLRVRQVNSNARVKEEGEVFRA